MRYFQEFNWAYLSLIILAIDVFLLWQISQKIKDFSCFSNPLIAKIKSILFSTDLNAMAVIGFAYLGLLLLGILIPLILLILVLVQGFSLMTNMFVLSIILNEYKK